MQHTLQPVAALMMDEAREFEILDALPPFDDYGNVAWSIRRGANDPPREALAGALHEAEREIACQSTEPRAIS